jgi:hypothetical protein
MNDIGKNIDDIIELRFELLRILKSRLEKGDVATIKMVNSVLTELRNDLMAAMKESGEEIDILNEIDGE